MRLTKRQVMNILKELKKMKTRPILKNIAIQKHKNGNYHLTYTNGCMAVYIPLEENEDIKSGIVPFEKIEVWYKLASAKDFIDTNWIIENTVEEDSHNKFMDTERFIESEVAEVEKIALNAELLNHLQLVFGTVNVELEFTGQYKPINVTASGTDIFAILLPMKITKIKRS